MPTKDDILESIAEDFLKALRSGKSPPSPSYYTKKCPALEDEIRDLLKSLQQLESFSDRETRRRKQQAPAIPQPSLASKPQSLGEFEIVREIGRGGMGTVYLAADRVLDRRVALKVLQRTDSNLGAPETERELRFQREARLASRLHHTNIVPVFGVGHGDSHLYYAMQYIDGVDLRKILNAMSENRDSLRFTESLVDQAREWIAFDLESEHARSSDATRAIDRSSADSISGTESGANDFAHPTTEHPSSDSATRATPPRVDGGYWRSVATIGSQVCDALQYAHSMGVMHRDIKPSNLLLDRDGSTWVTDFGLAKLDETEDLTRTGNILGTLRYISPEQLEGKETFLSDVYSVGLTLYELLTAEPAHQANSYRQLLREKTEGLQRRPTQIVPNLPRDLETIVLKAIHPRPEDRYASAGDMRDDLNRFLMDQPIAARRASPLEMGMRWCRKNKAVASLLAVVASLSIALPISLGIAYGRAATQRQQAEEQLHIALDGLDELFRSFVNGPNGMATVNANSAGLSNAPAPVKLTPETGRFLQRMLDFYDRLAKAKTVSSPRLQQESARAFQRVGDIYQALGQFDSALDAYDESKARFLALTTDSEDTFRFDIANVDLQRGRTLVEGANRDNAMQDALAAFQDVLQRLESGKTKEEKLLLVQAHLACTSVYRNRPFDRPMPFDLRSFLDSVESPRRGRPPGGPLWNLLGFNPGPPGPGRRPRDGAPRPRDRDDNVRGGGPRSEDRERRSNQPSSDHDHVNQALSILNQLASDGAGEGSAATEQDRLLRAVCLRELAPRGLLRDSEQRTEAAAILQELVQEYPENPVYQFELSQTLRAVNAHVLPNNEVRFAIDQLEQARSISESLAAKHDQIALYRINLAHIYANLGMLHERVNHTREAEEFARLAFQAHNYVLENIPGLESTSRNLLAGPAFSLARQLLRKGQGTEALEILLKLKKVLQEQASDTTIGVNFRDKAAAELQACHELIEHLQNNSA
ncbi:MAG: serine/threonine-protein kinase [Planctomycetota bacterium]